MIFWGFLHLFELLSVFDEFWTKIWAGGGEGTNLEIVLLKTGG